MIRVYGTKRDDFANGRAGLTEHVAKRSKGLILLGATVHMDRGLHGGVELRNVTYADEMLRFHVWKDGVVDECAPASAGLGKTRI